MCLFYLDGSNTLLSIGRVGFEKQEGGQHRASQEGLATQHKKDGTRTHKEKKED